MPEPDDGSSPLANITKTNWRRPELSPRSFQQVEQIMPTSTVDRGTGPVSELATDLADLTGFTFPDHTGERRSSDDYLVEEHVDALIVWRNGKVRQEYYGNGQTRRSRHIVFSVTKSFTGLVAELLIAEGKLDETKLVTDYVSELKSSAWEGATLRELLNMEIGIDFTEIYDDPNSSIYQFSYAAGFRPVPAGVRAYPSLYEFLPSLRKKGEHGKDFHYVTANSEVLGWVVEKVTGIGFARSFEQRVYTKIGAERDAFYATDPHGKAIAGGGISVTAPMRCGWR